MDRHEIGGIPILARQADLESSQPVVIVIHGMSTTAETMRAGWPDTTSDGITRVYWRLPILREERTVVIARQQEDIFRSLFWPVVEEARRELTQLIAALRREAVGLFGFSIGGLISLWGALDNPEVKASVAVGGVPYLEYLLHYFPNYDWQSPDVKERRLAVDLSHHVVALAQRPTLVLHGLADDQAKWEWMQPFSDALLQQTGTRHARHVYSHVVHRLVADGHTQEETDLNALRRTATEWLTAHLGNPESR